MLGHTALALPRTHAEFMLMFASFDATALQRQRAMAAAIADSAAQVEVSLGAIAEQARVLVDVSGWQSRAMDAYVVQASAWSDDVQYLREQVRILSDDLHGLPSRVSAEAWGGL